MTCLGPQYVIITVVDPKTKDMLKEAYMYGWAHAIEEVEKQLRTINLQPNYVEGFDELIVEMCDMLKCHANRTKNKN